MSLQVKAPPAHTLARRFFEHTCMLLTPYLAPVSHDTYVIVDPVGLANALRGLASRAWDLWLTANDRRVVNKLCSLLGVSGGVSDIVRGYANALSLGSVPTGVFTAPSVLKATMYEHARGLGYSRAERVRLDVHQMVLSLLGAAIAKAGRVRAGNQMASMYLVCPPGARIATYLTLLGRVRTATRIGRSLDVPESVKCLLVAEVALRCSDYSGNYGEELLVVEGGMKATLFRRGRMTSGGLVASLAGVKPRLRAALVSALRDVVDSYLSSLGLEAARSYVQAVERVAEALVAYVNTGSRDYQYVAVSSITRLLDSEADAVNAAAKAYMTKLSKVLGVSRQVDLPRKLRLLARAVAVIRPAIEVAV